MRLTPFALAALALLPGCQKQEPEGLAVRDAWVRLAAVPGRPAAAYFTITGGPAKDTLTAVDADKVATIELHESGMAGGMMSMKPMAGIDVPANGEAAFKPGGNHAMLFGIDPSIRPGRALPLTFRFQSGKSLSANATVYAAGDIAPE